MVKGLYTAYTGMINEQNRMDVLTNNLANSDTNGFKKEGATSQAFDSLLALKIKDRSENPNLAHPIGIANLGVKVGENYTDYSQGAFKVTDRTYDVALSGEGFFNIEYTNKAGETSVKYTRDGSFVLTTDGYLVTKDGDYVLNEAGALNSTTGEASYIRVDPSQPILVDSDGRIYQNDELVGNIGIVDVEDYNYIEHYGENLYQLHDGGRIIASDADCYQGVLEMSNVNVVSEMVQMINVTRAYESNQKVIQTIDTTLEKAVNLGRLG